MQMFANIQRWQQRQQMRNGCQHLSTRTTTNNEYTTVDFCLFVLTIVKLFLATKQKALTIELWRKKRFQFCRFFVTKFEPKGVAMVLLVANLANLDKTPSSLLANVAASRCLDRKLPPWKVQTMNWMFFYTKLNTC